MGADSSPFFLTSTGKGFWSKGHRIKVDYKSDDFRAKARPCYQTGSMLGTEVQLLVWNMRQPAGVE